MENCCELPKEENDRLLSGDGDVKVRRFLLRLFSTLFVYL
jgi:hypothetical protein